MLDAVQLVLVLSHLIVRAVYVLSQDAETRLHWAQLVKHYAGLTGEEHPARSRVTP